MTLPVACELAYSDIRMTTITPGIFETPMMVGMSQEVRDPFGASTPSPSRPGRPDKYAALVRQIIENSILNGEAIHLDGAIRMATR